MTSYRHVVAVADAITTHLPLLYQNHRLHCRRGWSCCCCCYCCCRLRRLCRCRSRRRRCKYKKYAFFYYYFYETYSRIQQRHFASGKYLIFECMSLKVSLNKFTIQPLTLLKTSAYFFLVRGALKLVKCT